MDSKSQDSIQVCIRVKPGNQQESILSFTQNQVHLQKNHFGFDKIFSPNASQQQIFEAVGTKLISNTLDGYNGCIFVYGQTGSGKTYTMMGEGNGIMQQSFSKLFKEIDQMQKIQSSIVCSYIEIYNQQIIDLLDIKKDKKMNIRQDIKKGIFIQNIIEQSAYNEYKLLQCLNTGMKNRHVGQTMMNRESSRSHSIFTISLCIKIQVNGIQILKTPKLHFVDLAGSQRQKMTATSGERLKQAGNINKSLTTLGMVINALASQKSRTHIPYRDSKLTSLLRDSLGGNSKTFLIATVSRNILCFQQTLSTLNFANRAKMVKVKALVNEQSLSNNIQTFKQQIKKLKAEIAKLKSQKRTPNQSQIRWPCKQAEESINVMYDNQFKQINQKISVISDHLTKKSTSPSIQQLLEHIKKLKPQQSCGGDGFQQNQMIQQSEQFGIQNDKQTQDPLISYLSCNNSLLQKIHSKIDEYVQLKSQLRSMAYNNQLSIAALKTPSKFEREQLQNIIQKRNQQICGLHNQVRQLKNIITERQLRIEGLLTEADNKNNISEQNVQKFDKQRTQLHKQLILLKNIIKQTSQEIEYTNQRYQEIMAQARQNKQLYIYAQQNYETEHTLREQVEKNLLQKIKMIEQLKYQHQQKMLQQKQYFEQIQEGLKQQLNVLTQTIEFNENRINDFKTKLQNQKNNSQSLIKLTRSLQNDLTQSKSQRQNLQRQLRIACQTITLLKNEGQKLSKEYEQKLQNLRNQYSLLQSQLNKSMIQNQQIVSMYKMEADQLQSKIVRMQTQLKDQSEQYINYQITSENKLFDIQMNHKLQFQQLQNAHQKQCEIRLSQLQQKTKVQQQLVFKNKQLQAALNELKQLLNQSQLQIMAIRQESQNRIQRVYLQTKQRLQQVKVMQIQNEQLKKQYKILQKQNFKIKARYSQNNNKTQQQLALKVDYYEQKFKLMSIQYQKAVEVVKRLKQKQIAQSQKINCLEQSQKILKISLNNQRTSNQEQVNLKKIYQQNVQLRKQIQRIKPRQQPAISYSNKMTIQQQKTALKQKQQYFKSKIEQSIKRWDPSKQNAIMNRSLQDLISCWEEIQRESCRKFDAIAKGIKREQKLKTQNNLILKQNLYLKQQILANNNRNDDCLGGPKKRVKLVKQDLSQIPEQSMD